MITRVPPGTWETLSFPSSQAAGDTAYQLQIDPRLRVRGRGGRTTDATMVSPSEGNEARRDGRQGVAAPHSTVEAGERPFRTPWSEGGAALWTGSWNHAEDTVPHQRVTAKPTQSCEGQRFHNVTNRMHLTCTSGSVGGATRSYGCICYDWSYDQDITQCATTGTLPRRAAGVIRRCEALGTTYPHPTRVVGPLAREPDDC